MGNYWWRCQKLNKVGEEWVADNWKTRSFVLRYHFFFDKSIVIRIWYAQIPATKFCTMTPIILGPHYGPCFMSPFWRLEVWDWFPKFLEKFGHPWYMGTTQRRESAKFCNLVELQRNVVKVCSGPSLIKANCLPAQWSNHLETITPWRLTTTKVAVPQR
jgi:hypothetical protein